MPIQTIVCNSSSIIHDSPRYKKPKFPSKNPWMMNMSMNTLGFSFIKDRNEEPTRVVIWMDLLHINAKCMYDSFSMKSLHLLKGMSLPFTCLFMPELKPMLKPLSLQNIFLFFLKSTLFVTFICLCGVGWRVMCKEIRGQFVSNGSLLPPWALGIKHRLLGSVPLPAEPSRQP